MKLFAFLLLPLACFGQFTFVTDPEHQANQDVIITAQDNTTVDIYCAFYYDGGQVDTDWKIRNEGEFELLSFLGNGFGIGNYSFIQRYGSYRENITVTFTQANDRTKISCSAGSATPIVFFIGILVPPEIESIDTVHVTEGTSHIVQLNSTNNDPFPPTTNGIWSFNNGPITDDTISVTTYSITFHSVTRNQSGIYNLTVTNEAGSDNASFILNVQYAPEGTRGQTIVYAQIEDTVNLTAFTDFMSNPSPHYQLWNSPDGRNLTMFPYERFTGSFSDTIQLTIANVTNDDNGTWRFGAINTVGNIAIEIDLIIAFPPGSSQNLTSLNVTDDSVLLSWEPPSDTGTPSITHYILTIVTPDVLLTTRSIDSSYMLTGLIPYTQYNVTVVAVSSNPFITLTGQPSDSINFRTLPGPPKVRMATSSDDNNGNIQVNWMFEHIGGANRDQVHITVVCTPLQDSEPESSSGSGMIWPQEELRAECSGDEELCLNSTYQGSIKLGPVNAGERYLCAMSVDIDTFPDGDYHKNLSYIVPQTGIPSAPTGSVTSTEDGGLLITVASKWAGIPSGDSSFKFHVIINDGIVNETYSFPNYTNNRAVNLSIPSLPNGTYIIRISAANTFGISPDLTLEYYIPMASHSSTTILSPTSTPTNTTISIAAIAGGIVGGLIVLILLLLLILLIPAVVVWQKKHKGKFNVPRTKVEPLAQKTTSV